jgi:serine/threonine-protein kinase HipA
MNAASDDGLEGLRAIDEADVFKAGRRAATLTRNENGVEFRYLDAWVDAGGPPVATTLPVTSDPILRAGVPCRPISPACCPKAAGWAHSVEQ